MNAKECSLQILIDSTCILSTINLQFYTSQNRDGRSRSISPIQMTHIQPTLLYLILMVTITI